MHASQGYSSCVCSIFPNSNESAKKTCYNCSIMHQIQLVSFYHCSECSNNSDYHYVAAGILERTCTVPSYIHRKFLLESI